MSRERPKSVYQARVKKFGNGARIKGFKAHIGEEVIIMRKKDLKKDIKLGEIDDKYIEEYYEDLD